MSTLIFVGTILLLFIVIVLLSDEGKVRRNGGFVFLTLAIPYIFHDVLQGAVLVVIGVLFFTIKSIVNWVNFRFAFRRAVRNARVHAPAAPAIQAIPVANAPIAGNHGFRIESIPWLYIGMAITLLSATYAGHEEKWGILALSLIAFLILAITEWNQWGIVKTFTQEKVGPVVVKGILSTLMGVGKCLFLGYGVTVAFITWFLFFVFWWYVARRPPE